MYESEEKKVIPSNLGDIIDYYGMIESVSCTKIMYSKEEFFTLGASVNDVKMCF